MENTPSTQTEKSFTCKPVLTAGEASERADELAGSRISLAAAATSIIFVATNICRDKHNFAATSLPLSQQTRLCRNKTRLLSRQKYACCDKTFVATNMQTVYFPVTFLAHLLSMQRVLMKILLHASAKKKTKMLFKDVFKFGPFISRFQVTS